MAHTIHDLDNGFWTIRGNYHVAGILNFGTQAGLVQLSSGNFVLLDCYTLTGDVRDTVMKLTDNGRAVQAVLNLHPFHTMHCAAIARDFPGAKLYGSTRHHRRLPELDWQPDLVESPRVQEMFADDLTFSLPRGIDYISSNEKVHAGSLLAWHPRSRTLHVDDTICLLSAPGVLKGLFPQPKLILHPTTGKALLKEAGAVEALEGWMNELADLTHDLRWLCAAHAGHVEYREAGRFGAQLREAFGRVRGRLGKALDK